MLAPRSEGQIMALLALVARTEHFRRGRQEKVAKIVHYGRNE